MQESRPSPVRLFEDEEALVVDWSDGHQSRLTWDRLRRNCPCAQCREENAANLDRDDSDRGTAARPDGMERVGRYAVSFRWKDGHAGGIYSWQVLRELCDCFPCRMKRLEV